MNGDYQTKMGQSLEEAGNYILDLVEKFIPVNTFCITSIYQEQSYFISVFNRSDTIASSGVKISVYDAY
ncbi:hypothetical protein [Alkalihalobacterium chitinilyticum]|uniref:Uncharacterized protein n=1 Tax=Alkalihalobacterium chitinilyticum TaxID=2980103 RepID=A0ABT5VIL7_9BACI|nr:hypothetical protein [Alkalihalobacterium chitinilyticum]MDE5415157.1 hypothetical protein [Alkalihalobacterium chitinilyticum]